jgi:hypothetical protein
MNIKQFFALFILILISIPASFYIVEGKYYFGVICGLIFHYTWTKNA